MVVLPLGPRPFYTRNPRGASYFLRIKRVAARSENPAGRYFFRTLSGKAFAWIWKARDRELIIVEMSCQGVFRRDDPFEPPARPLMSDLEWRDIRQAVIDDLETQLRKVIEGKGPRWRSRARNLRWAVEVGRRQMAVPWEWRSMPEVAPDVPGLEAGLRGGLADLLKRRIGQARKRALGEATDNKSDQVTDVAGLPLH
jgi:hypothetical protein